MKKSRVLDGDRRLREHKLQERGTPKRKGVREFAALRERAAGATEALAAAAGRSV